MKYKDSSGFWKEIDMPVSTIIHTVEPEGGTATLPEEALIISGYCNYAFANGHWDWFIDLYGDEITTQDIDNAEFMFSKSTVKSIPFELNFKPTTSYHHMGYSFSDCFNLEEVPKLNNLIVYSLNNMFNNCWNLKEIPDDLTETWDWSYSASKTSTSSGSFGYMFSSCRKLRYLPIEIFGYGNPYLTSSNCLYYYMCNDCFSLDELVNIPVPNKGDKNANNNFVNFITDCHRLKRLKFALDNGQPYIVNWALQTIDCSTLGYFKYASDAQTYTDFKNDTRVKDDASYQALKDDPNWYTLDVAYSRYNHDSAVATINSLPDTSAYLASAGGTNTIKFKGAAGSATDGGAINTLTDAEIAVAASRGWTVTLS